MTIRRITTTTVAIGAGLLLAVAVPLAASAHVTVAPDQAEAGGYALLTFKVPTESATATTTRVEVALPQGTPLSSVSYVPVPGWTAVVTRSTLAKPVKVGENEITSAATSVTWTAQPGFAIKQGELQLFPLSVGPVPSTGRIAFPAEQTYSDGTVVGWTGKAGTEHPAPVLYVNDAPPTDDEPAVTATPIAAPPAAASAPDVLARGLGIGGLVVGAIGVVLAIVTLRRRDAK